MTDLQGCLKSNSLAKGMNILRKFYAVQWREGYLVQDPLHTLDTVNSLELRLSHLVDVPITARKTR